MSQTNQARNPAVVTPSQLATILRDMAHCVENLDCWEGSIEFHYGEDEFFGVQDGEFGVLGIYRIGNLQGQGGMRLIDDDHNPFAK